MPALDAIHLRSMWAEDLVANRYLRDMTASYVHTATGVDADSPDTKNFMAVTGEDAPLGDENHWLTRYNSEPSRFVADLRRWVDAGLTYYVDPRMHALVTAASESMPEEVLVSRDLPSDYGFMLIPGGLAVIDVRGRILKYNAVQWAAFGGKVHVMWLTDKYDMTDSGNLLMRAKYGDSTWMDLPRLSVGHAGEMRFGAPLPITYGPDFIVPPERKLHVLQKQNEDGSKSMGWAFDKGYTPDELTEKMTVSARTDPAARWLLTTWRLMQQSVTSVTEETAPRQMRRSLERKNLDTKVTVIALRHAASRGEGESDVEWSHRWLVRGHWRNQPCKEDGEWTTRLVWIHPYVKGPEDRPLLIRDHVYSLVR